METNDPRVSEAIDFTFDDSLNGRELAQLIVGTLSGRTYAAEERSFDVRVDAPRVAAVVAALVQAGWTVRQTIWGGADKSVTLRVWTE